MSTKAYSSNILAHRNPVVNLSSTINITENTTILVRLWPDEVTLDIPFNRVTTWNRLIQTIFDIYMRNNPSARYLTIDDALDNIKIKNDRTGGIILPELWPDFIKPQVKVAAIFDDPFLPPPWVPKFDAEVKREEEDIEMMEGVVTYATEPKLGGFIETADWRRQANRLLGPPPSKADDTEHFHLLSTSSNAIPAPPFTYTSTFTNSWTSMETEKSRLRHHSNMNGTSLVSEVFTEAVLARRSVSQEPTMDSMIEGGVSPPPSIYFRNPFPQSGLSGSSPPPAVFPQRFTPVRHIPSDANSRTPTQSPECSGRPVRDANPRPAKRKRDEEDGDKIGSSSREGYNEPPRKSRSPFQSSGSNGGVSRAQSVDIDAPGELARVTNPISRARTSDSASSRTVVLHQKLMLLDSINAGEMVKIIRTKDGHLVVIRDDEEPEDFMERRQSTASIVSFSGPREKSEIGTTKTSRKRPHGEAPTDELVRIWSGCGPEPPAKRTKAKLYNKLTHEQKYEIQKFVQEQHIIRIDHFTNPVIQEWKTRIIPEADPKQTEEYLEEVASNKYNDTNKKKEAYRLFMENHNHSHKNSDSTSSTKAKAIPSNDSTAFS